jgi:hypothetical protein
MEITCGNVVRGHNFFNREELIAKIWQILKTDNILLAAPRRVGKTSVMHRLLDYPEDGFIPIFIDVEHLDGPEEFIRDLIMELITQKEESFEKIKSLFKKVKSVELWQFKIELRDIVQNRWQAEGERIIKATFDPNRKLLIIIDELPLLLHKLMNRKDESGIQKANDLLDWLRYIRVHKDFNQNVRMIVGGSIGLPQIANMLGSSLKINDLMPVEVLPLSIEQAREMVIMLFDSRGLKINEESMNTLLDQIGTFVPVFIQIMVACVSNEMKDKKVEVSPQLIIDCYENRALGPEYRLAFDDYYQRLDRYYAEGEVKAAKRVLKEIAIAPGNVGKNALFSWYANEIGEKASEEQFESLMTWLKDDFYLVEITPGNYIFKLRWLKDWWRKYHA